MCILLSLSALLSTIAIPFYYNFYQFTNKRIEKKMLLQLFRVRIEFQINSASQKINLIKQPDTEHLQYRH